MSKKSALEIIGGLPKVGGSYGNFDIGQAYKYGLDIAYEILRNESTDKDRRDWHTQLHKIFWDWMYDYGLYPPNKPFFGLGGDRVQKSIPEYFDELEEAAQKDGKQPDYLEPWQCCPYVETMVGLFEQLLAEQYPPLVSFMEDKWHKFSAIRALMIIFSNDPKKSEQSAECLKSAMSLAKSALESQRNMIKIMEPDAKAGFNRRQGIRLKAAAKKEETEESVRRAYIELCVQNIPPKNLQTAIADRVGIKQPQVSKILDRLGLRDRKFDALIPRLKKNIPKSGRNK